MSAGPVLVTQRLELWKPVAADLDALVTLIDHEQMVEFLGPAKPSHLNQFERLLRNAGSWALYGYGVFMVRPRGSPELIGSCGMFHSRRGFPPECGMEDVPEAGWIVRRDWWGKGVASEAMAAALDWFDREHGARRIACMIEEGNAASEAVAERLGFATCGSHQPDDSERPLVLYERG